MSIEPSFVSSNGSAIMFRTCSNIIVYRIIFSSFYSNNVNH